MELFGILFSIPAAFIASTIYCFFLYKCVSHYPRLCQWFRTGSFIVLGGFAIEVFLLILLGPIRSRTYLGPGFYLAHMIFFIFGTPALANLTALRKKGGVYRLWFLTPIWCTIFAFCLVVLQYVVSEALYGINGNDGPFS